MTDDEFRRLRAENAVAEARGRAAEIAKQYALNAADGKQAGAEHVKMLILARAAEVTP